MTRLYIKLIGCPRLFDEEGRPIPLKGRKITALLALVARCPDQEMSRRDLAEMLWGEGTGASSLANLRQTLARLRSQLPDQGKGLIISSSEALALSSESVSVDLDAVHDAVREGDHRQLQQAAALCDGDFLDGLTLNAAGFEQWLSEQRSRVADLKVDLFSRLLGHQVAERDFDAALSTGNRLPELDPCDEFAHRTLMSVYLSMGRRSAALRQYTICAEALRGELRTSPEPATEALHQAIVSHTLPAAPRQVLAPRAIGTGYAAEVFHRAARTIGRNAATAIETTRAAMRVTGGAKMTEQTQRVLMTVDHHSGDFADGLLTMINENGGKLLGRVNGAMISMFPNIAAATACAETLQRRAAWRERVVVTVGPVAVQSPPLHGEGVDAAMSLLNATGAGEIAISPIANKPPVHRIRALDDGRPDPSEDSKPLFAALQWAGLLGYFAFRMSMITYSVYHFWVHKKPLCWPDFLCGG